MPAAKGKAAAPNTGAAAAAQAERNGHVSLDFHGVTLKLPSKLPNSFAMRFARIASKSEHGDISVAGDIYDLLVPKYVSEDQYLEIMDAVDESDEDFGLSDLVVAVAGSYGAETGESEASVSS